MMCFVLIEMTIWQLLKMFFLTGIVRRCAVSLLCVAHYLVYGSVTGVTGGRIFAWLFLRTTFVMWSSPGKNCQHFCEYRLLRRFPFWSALLARTLAALASAELAAAFFGGFFDAGLSLSIPELWDICFVLCGWLSFVFVAIVVVDSLNCQHSHSTSLRNVLIYS